MIHPICGEHSLALNTQSTWPLRGEHGVNRGIRSSSDAITTHYPAELEANYFF